MTKKLAVLSLLFVSVFSVFSFYNLQHLTFDYELENFFPFGDEDLEYYKNFSQQFGNDNDYLLIAIENNSSVFDQSFLKGISAITEEIANLPNINTIVSPSNSSRVIISNFGAIEIPLIHITEPERYYDDSVKIFRDSIYVNRLISEDAKSIALLIKHKQKLGKKDSDSLIASILSIVEKQQISDYHIAGKIYARSIFIEKIKYELLVFMGSSLILTILFLLLIYRSIWETIVPLLTVFLSAIWISGVMGFLRKPIDVIMVMLPTIIFVVTMSDIIHILTKYVEELRLNANREQALKVTIKEVGMATFLTSLTTAVGFFSLTTSSIKPIREFGIYTGVGVILAFILAFSLLPAALYFRKSIPNIAMRDNFKKRWRRILVLLFSNVLRYRKQVVLFFIFISLISLYGLSKLEINAYLIDDISDEDSLKKSFTFFDNNFGGSRPFELAIWSSNDTTEIYDLSLLLEIEKIEHYLESTYGVSNILSPLFLIKGINQSVNGGLQKNFCLPKNAEEYKRVYKQLSKYKDKVAELRVVSPDNLVGRISGRMSDMGSKLTGIKNKELEKFILMNIDSSLIHHRLTGSSLLIDKNNESLVSNTLQGLTVAFIVVAFIVGLLFKSLRMVIITLIPNVIPLIMVAAIMGFFGITLKLSTSIIFTIAFGIAVDDSIHFISKLKIELAKGKSLMYAIKRTYFSTGKALIITTIVLSSGFMILVFSSFGGTFYTGLMVGLTLLFALLTDLTLLPVLLFMFSKK